MRFVFKYIVGFYVCCVASAVPADACSTVIVSAGASSTGRPLIWKQRDALNPYNVLKHIIPSDGYSFTALFNADDSLCRQAYAGVNVAGFAIVNNLSYNIAETEYVSENGVVLRLALEKCSSVEEFEDLIENLPVPRRIKANFGVADISGAAAYFEVGDYSMERFDVPCNGYLYRTNFSVSGKEGGGKGAARYQTEEYLLARHKGKFSSEDLIEFGRSYYNAVLGEDMSRKMKKAIDIDFIPRTSTVSSLCIELPTKSERSSSSVIWTAIGYTPCCYAVPVWLEAGNEIPYFVTSYLDDKRAEASVLAKDCRDIVHPEDRDAKELYIDFTSLKPIMSLVRKYERTEFAKGRELDGRVKKIFDMSEVRKHNLAMQERFNSFKQNVIISVGHNH